MVSSPTKKPKNRKDPFGINTPPKKKTPPPKKPKTPQAQRIKIMKDNLDLLFAQTLPPPPPWMKETTFGILGPMLGFYDRVFDMVTQVINQAQYKKIKDSKYFQDKMLKYKQYEALMKRWLMIPLRESRQWLSVDFRNLRNKLKDVKDVKKANLIRRVAKEHYVEMVQESNHQIVDPQYFFGPAYIMLKSFLKGGNEPNLLGKKAELRKKFGFPKEFIEVTIPSAIDYLQYYEKKLKEMHKQKKADEIKRKENQEAIDRAKAAYEAALAEPKPKTPEEMVRVSPTFRTVFNYDTPEGGYQRRQETPDSDEGPSNRRTAKIHIPEAVRKYIFEGEKTPLPVERILNFDSDDDTPRKSPEKKKSPPKKRKSPETKVVEPTPKKRKSPPKKRKSPETVVSPPVPKKKTSTKSTKQKKASKSKFPRRRNTYQMALIEWNLMHNENAFCIPRANTRDQEKVQKIKRLIETGAYDTWYDVDNERQSRHLFE